MKTNNVLSLLVSIIILSCSSSDNESTMQPIENFRLVKSIDDGLKFNYTYTNDLLSNTSAIEEDYSLQINYTYDENDNIINRSSIESSGTDMFQNTINYTYNDNDKLISYTTSQGFNVNLNYDANNIMVDFEINNNNYPLQLQLDNNEKVIRLETEGFYKIFSYDINNNLIRNEEFDNNDVLIKKFEYNFDENINPFFNQLESIYLEKFISLFRISGSSFTDSFYFDFPYFENNLTSFSLNDILLNNYVIEFDLDGYPISIDELQSDYTLENNYIIEY